MLFVKEVIRLLHRFVQLDLSPQFPPKILICSLAIMWRSLSSSTRVTMVFFCMASCLLGHGAYHDVVHEITLKLAQTPDDAALRFKLACAHQEHGEWTSSLAELERVERLAAGKFETGFVKGQSLATGGHWLSAKATLDEFLRSHVDHAGALAQRARVLMKLEQKAEALADFQKALVKADNPAAELFLETSSALVKSGELEQAVLVLRRGIERLGFEPALLVPSLDLELAARHFDEALVRAKAMQKTAPRPEPWMLRRAEILQQAGRADDAKAAWRSLRNHLLALPNLERGTPLLAQIFTDTQRALGLAAPAPVIAAPALPPKP